MDERLTQISARVGDERLASGSGAPGASGSGIGAVVSGLDDLFDRAGRLLGRKAGSTAAASNEAGDGMSDALRRARNRALGTPDQDDVLARARRQIAAQAESVSSAPGQGDGSRASSPGVTNLFDAALQVVEGLRGRRRTREACGGREARRATCGAPGRLHQRTRPACRGRPGRVGDGDGAGGRSRRGAEAGSTTQPGKSTR